MTDKYIPVTLHELVPGDAVDVLMNSDTPYRKALVTLYLEEFGYDVLSERFVLICIRERGGQKIIIQPDIVVNCMKIQSELHYSETIKVSVLNGEENGY